MKEIGQISPVFSRRILTELTNFMIFVSSVSKNEKNADKTDRFSGFCPICQYKRGKPIKSVNWCKLEKEKGKDPERAFLDRLLRETLIADCCINKNGRKYPR